MTKERRGESSSISLRAADPECMMEMLNDLSFCYFLMIFFLFGNSDNLAAEFSVVLNVVLGLSQQGHL